jgi:signal transduction histidine kinase
MFPHPEYARRLADLVLELEARAERGARLLHDEVGPTLTAVGLHLQALGESGEPIQELREHLSVLMERVREASQTLHFNPVERSGLTPALEMLVMEAQDSGVQIKLLIDNTGKYPPILGYTFFRVIELAIHNVIRHANVSRAEVRVKATARNFSATIADRGCGFEVARALSQPRGTGLILMESYARKNSLQLRITSVPGKGTIVRVQTS